MPTKPGRGSGTEAVRTTTPYESRSTRWWRRDGIGELSSDGVLDLNLPAVKVSGMVAINGKAMPAATGERGNLDFRLKDGSSYSAPSFGASSLICLRRT